MMNFASWSMGRLYGLVLMPALGAELLSNTIARTVIDRSKRKVQLISPLPHHANLEFRDRVLSYDEARLLGRPHGLLNGDPEGPEGPMPDHFVARLEALDGDFTPLIKPARTGAFSRLDPIHG
jgi:hypothetical protein